MSADVVQYALQAIAVPVSAGILANGVEELMIEASAGGKVAEQHFIKGDPDVVVPRLAKTIDADVVILGSAARTGLRGWPMVTSREPLPHWWRRIARRSKNTSTWQRTGRRLAAAPCLTRVDRPGSRGAACFPATGAHLVVGRSDRRQAGV